MPPKNTLADAWDDDWESLADVHVPLFLACIRSRLVERRREASRRAAEAKAHKGTAQGPACRVQQAALAGSVGYPSVTAYIHS